MLNKELIGQVAEKTGLPKTAVASVLDALVDTAQETLASGDTVSLPGLGKFSVRDTPERKVKSPTTGVESVVPAGKRVKFAAAAAMKLVLKGA